MTTKCSEEKPSGIALQIYTTTNHTHTHTQTIQDHRRILVLQSIVVYVFTLSLRLYSIIIIRRIFVPSRIIITVKWGTKGHLLNIMDSENFEYLTKERMLSF